MACSHLRLHPHHQHYQQQHNTHHQLCSPHLPNVSSTCDHHHHYHNSSDQTRGFASSTANQSTCLAVTPFRKPIELSHYHNHHHLHNSPCCSSLLASASQMIAANSELGTSLRPMSANGMTAPQSSSVSIDCRGTTNRLANPRSASPAQVTSSSSPLSTSLGNSQNEPSRTGENKLKENIEYLTALLCNGNNKIDGSIKSNCCSQHQAPISSTVMKSYTTLSHSLSTSPKLLDRPQTQIPALTSRVMNGPFQQQHQPGVSVEAPLCQHTNEAASCLIESGLTDNQVSSDTLKRPSNEQWFKPNVESSVSAADSTDCNISSRPSSAAVHNCVASGNVNVGQSVDVYRDGRSSDLKVLSTLLNSGKCNPNQVSCSVPGFHPQIPRQTHTLVDPTPGCWQEQPVCNPVVIHQVPQQHLQQKIAEQPDGQSMVIPAQFNQHQANVSVPTHQPPSNGRLITLTPVTSQNSLTISQQNAQKSRSNTIFAQPASPSASSTASSGNNIDISSNSNSNSNSTITPLSSAKRQRGANLSSGQTGSRSSTSSNASKAASSAGRPSSLSTDCSLSSHDEGFSSQVDNEDCNSNRDSDDDDDDDIDSDDESFYGDYTNSDLIGASISDDAENKWTLNMGRTRRNGQKRYFWQYNVQSKGPKGSRICQTDDSDDPFILSEASDPVFSSDCQVEGVKHSGKARRGDGNDLTPNPRKLLMIGLELKKLGKIINELAPVSDLPINARNKTRKEKNKLASRACRLKKKAQHEANKIKLYGLQREHQQAVKGICEIRKILNQAIADREAARSDRNFQIARNPDGTEISLEATVRGIAEQCSMKVVGQTSDYVNSVLEKVVSGFIDGGLET